MDQDPVTYLHPGLSHREAEILRRLYDADIAAMDREIGSFLSWRAATSTGRSSRSPPTMESG